MDPLPQNQVQTKTDFLVWSSLVSLVWIRDSLELQVFADRAADRHTYLAETGHALDEHEEDDDPGDAEARRQPPVEAAQVLDPVRHVQHPVTETQGRVRKHWSKFVSRIRQDFGGAEVSHI